MKELSVRTEDGFDLAVQISGREDGPPLLLLAGQANSHLWWTDLRHAFDDHCRVITVDYRGTGRSRGPVDAWSTSSFAADAAHVLASVGVTSAAVYGTSMGGRVAQMLAVEHPALVHRLVLACTSPGGAHAVERSPAVRRSLGEPDTATRRRTLHELFYTEAWPHPPEDSHLFGDVTMTAAESRAHLRASDRHDAWDALPRISAPTLVLHGGADRMAPVQNAHLLASRIPTARTHVVERGRHGFFHEFAAELHPLIVAFLENPDAAGRPQHARS
jgi:pimeloyl-ACP methyl ester carboxylesterase